MPRKAHGFLPRGGEEAAEVTDACVQPSLPRGLVSISTHSDGVWQLHNRQEIRDPRIHLAPILALEKPVLPNSENPMSISKDFKLPHAQEYGQRKGSKVNDFILSKAQDSLRD